MHHNVFRTSHNLTEKWDLIIDFFNTFKYCNFPNFVLIWKFHKENLKSFLNTDKLKENLFLKSGPKETWKFVNKKDVKFYTNLKSSHISTIYSHLCKWLIKYNILLVNFHTIFKLKFPLRIILSSFQPQENKYLTLGVKLKGAISSALTDDSTKQECQIIRWACIFFYSSIIISTLA